MALNPNALVSLTDTKTQLGISGSADDALVESFINAASEYFEQMTHTRLVKLGSDDVTEYQTSESQNIFYPFQYFEADSITSFKVLNAGVGNGDTELVLNTDYSIRNQQLYVGFAISEGLTVELIYDPGYGTVPSDIKVACINLVGFLWNRRNNADATQLSVDSVSKTFLMNADKVPLVDTVIQKYRIKHI